MRVLLPRASNSDDRVIHGELFRSGGDLGDNRALQAIGSTRDGARCSRGRTEMGQAAESERDEYKGMAATCC